MVSVKKTFHPAVLPGKGAGLLFGSFLFLMVLLAGCFESEQINQPPPAEVTLSYVGFSQNDFFVEEAASAQLSLYGQYSDGSVEEITSGVTWSSSNETIASVDASGILTGHLIGSGTITASYQSFTATLSFEVYPKPPEPVSIGNLTVIPVSPVTTQSFGTVDFSVNIPVSPVSIGVVLIGTNHDFKFIEHKSILLGDGGNIRGPDGNPITALAFNQIDLYGTGEADYGDNLLNYQAAALYFPNDGTVASLPSGTYTFPVGSADPVYGFLRQDVVRPYVYYKVTPLPAVVPHLNVNLWVVTGINGLTTALAAENDPEIAGMVAFLRNIYETVLGITLNITYRIVPDSAFSIIGTEAEHFQLLSDHPNPAGTDAINLFIISAFDPAYLETGVVGISSGIPGPFGVQGTIVSGVIGVYQYDGVGDELGHIMSHELGHFLGLWHTSQPDAYDDIIGHDPISDTAACTNTHLTPSKNFNNCPDKANLMFPFLGFSTSPGLSGNQKNALKASPAIHTN